MKYYCIALLLLLSGTVYAKESVTRGRFFYGDYALEEKKELPKETPQPQAPPPSKPTQDPYPYSTRMDAFQKETNEIINKAIFTLDLDDIAAQKARIVKILRHAREFVEKEQYMLIARPDLDETHRYPVNENAKLASEKQRANAIEESIKRLQKSHYIFYFFDADDEYSKLFSKVMRQFSQQYRFKTLAIKLTDKTLPEYPHAILNQGQAERLQLSHKPAVVIVPHDNPMAAEVVNYGHKSLAELKNNIFKVELQRLKHTKKGY